MDGSLTQKVFYWFAYPASFVLVEVNDMISNKWIRNLVFCLITPIGIVYFGMMLLSLLVAMTVDKMVELVVDNETK